MTCGIYEIVNTVNGKRYVGSSIDIEKRWKKHQQDLRKGSHHAQHLQHSWNKYGGDKFTMRVILKCERETLIENEQAELDKGYDYNSSPTAGNTLGLKFGDGARARVRASRKRMLKEDPDGFKARMSAISKGKPRSEEFKRKISDFHKGRKKSEEEVMRMRIGRSALDKKSVVSILCDRKAGMTIADIMCKHNVSHKQAQSICSGERYGWMHDGSLLITKEESMKRRVDQTRKAQNETIYNFMHHDYGERNCTQFDLRVEFPDIPSNQISRVCSGDRKSYKGWTLKKAP